MLHDCVIVCSTVVNKFADPENAFYSPQLITMTHTQCHNYIYKHTHTPTPLDPVIYTVCVVGS